MQQISHNQQLCTLYTVLLMQCNSIAIDMVQSHRNYRILDNWQADALIAYCYIKHMKTKQHVNHINLWCGPMFLDSELSNFGIHCLRMLSLLNQLTVSRIDLTVTVNTCDTVQTVRISSSEEISYYVSWIFSRYKNWKQVADSEKTEQHRREK